MIGLELVDGQGRPHKEAASRVCQECLERGLILMTCGYEDHVVRLMPPLIISDDLMDLAIDTIDAALASQTAG